MSVGSVGCDLARGGGEGDERSATLGLDRRQSSGCAAAGGTLNFARESFGEWVVAAGIEEDHRYPGTFLQCIDDLGKRYGFGRDVEFALKLCIGPDEEVFAAQLHAVPGVVEQGCVFRPDLARKV
ncbi:hypothetical protein D9M68_611750 [compost metagenome]